MEVAHSISQTCESNKWHPEVAEQTHKHRKRSYKTEPVQFELHLDFANPAAPHVHIDNRKSPFRARA